MSTTETFFSILKDHRESKGIQIDEISEYTKINPMYIEAIEEGNFDILPNVYMRLFLRSYATYLDVDSAKVLEDYELHTTGKIKNKSEFKMPAKEVESKPTPIKAEKPLNGDVDVSPKQIATVAAVVVAIFLVFQLISTISKEQQNNDAQITKKIEEETIPIQPVDYEEVDTLGQETELINNYSELPNLAILNNTDFDPLKKKANL